MRRVGDGPTTRRRKKSLVTETKTTTSQMDGESLTTRQNIQAQKHRTSQPRDGIMTRTSQTRKEAATSIRLLSHKRSTLIGTWNVRTMYETGKTAQVVREMERYNLDILGLSEVRWVTSGRQKLANGGTIIYSGLPKEDDEHREGVGFMLSKRATKCLIEWQPISERIITARFSSKFQKVSIIQCYSPTNQATDESKENFYGQLQSIMDKTPKRDICIVMGDMNAKVGSDNSTRETTMGKHGVGEMNENGELFADFCGTNELVIGGTLFPHKKIHKVTWTSPDLHTKNQIDHIAISRRWRRTLEDTRAKNGADVGSDHSLLVAKLKARITATKRSQNGLQQRHNIAKLQEDGTKQEFRNALQQKFQALQGTGSESIEGRWTQVKETYTQVCDEVLGFKRPHQKAWITEGTWKLIEERKVLKFKLDQARTRAQKQTAQGIYSAKNKQVKKSARKDKRTYIDNLATNAQQAAAKNDMKTLYNITKQLSGKRTNNNKPVKDKQGNFISNEREQINRWKEHFAECLNREQILAVPLIEEGDDLQIDLGPITQEEIIKAIKAQKNGKAPGQDNITPEVLKQDPVQSAGILHNLFQKIWEEETVPEDWRNGYIVKLPKKGDLSVCGNWRGIQLLSVPSKIMARVILERIKGAVDEELREEQAGFRRNRSCADQIATMRIIIEQSMEWQSSLYINFIDFEKAFDSVDRRVLWTILRHYGIPVKIIKIIQSFYQDMTCQVIHGTELTERFAVETGVRQGCLLSPLIFLLVIYWVMKNTVKTPRGIQWTLWSKLEDLDFADDISLISNTQQQMQEKTRILAEQASQVGLKINIAKSKVMRINETQDAAIMLGTEELEEVESFTYLGSIVNKTGGTEEDIKARTNKARYVFATLKPIWRSTRIRWRTKIRIFNTNVKSVLLYGAETWMHTKRTHAKLQTFVNRCLRQILRIRWPEIISNKDLWKKTQQKSVAHDIARRKWKWIGHTWRKEQTNITRQALDWNPQGKRKRGRPKNTWKRTTQTELESVKMTWAQTKTAAQDRQRWKAVVEDLCSAWNEEE